MINCIDEKEWFCNKIEEYKYSLYRLSLSILKNEQDAQDAVSEAICSAYAKLDTLSDKETFKPWMMRILTNASYDIYRKRKNICSLEETKEIPEKLTLDISEKLTLRQAVDRLEYDYRAVVVLFYYDDMSIKDISNILGVSQGAVKTRLSRARAKLLTMLKD